MTAPEGSYQSDVAFAALCDSALKRVYGLAGYVMGDPNEAEDAAQEAMARAWRSRRSLRDLAAFDVWLDRILINICRDRLRRRRAIQIVDLEVGQELETRNPFRDFLDREQLASAFEVLTPDQRILIVLRFWRDLSLEQISDRLGWPLGTVKSRLHHALTAMRGRLERDPEHELREVMR